MHNAAFRAAGIDAVYLPLPAADADDFVAFARAIGLKGASVTIPFKVALFERVDDACAAARRIGAINTIRVVDGKWRGANTDASGFLGPLQDRGVSVRGSAGRSPLASMPSRSARRPSNRAPWMTSRTS